LIVLVVEKIPLQGESWTSELVCQTSNVEELVVLTSRRSRDILGLLDFLVDIGAPAEKEVIQ
jgi:hypothetical protein